MIQLGKKLSIMLSIVLVVVSLSGLSVFAEGDEILVYGANGNATHIEKGTSMKMAASGVSQGTSVSWSVTDMEGSATGLATIMQTSPLTAILTASSSDYGTFKVVATQSASGKTGEQIIQITNENLITVDDTDASITYERAGSGEEWETNSNGSYYQGTGKCVIPPEDDSYSSSAPAYAEFTFTGTGIQWIGETNYYCGVAEVYLDGVKVSTVDPFIAPSIINQFINFSKEGLPYGQHTIKVVATGLKNPASTVYPGTMVLIDAFRYMPGSPVQEGPAAVLTGSDSVLPGETFTLGISLDQVTQNVYAEEIALSYDANVFEYVSVEGENNNIQVLKEKSEESGSLKIIAANIGGVTGQSTPVLKVTFQVKSGVQNTSGTIAVTKADLGIAPEGTVIPASVSSKTIRVGVTEIVDKSVLSAAITSAEAIYVGAVVGGQPGQYPYAAKDALRAAIDEAELVLNDSDATQGEVNSAITVLNAAVDAFKAAVVVEETSADLNEDANIDVLDLAIVAYYYGKDYTSEDWDQAKAADMNLDGKVDVSDLAYVAIRIVD